jgi:hypothetical protein
VRGPRRFQLVMVERDVEFVRERSSAGSEHLLSETVVVRATVLRGRGNRCGHLGRMAERVARASEAGPGILSDIQRAAVAYAFVRNVLALSCAAIRRWSMHCVPLP